MTDTKQQRTRTKQLTVEQLYQQLSALPLSDKVSVYTALKNDIENERAALVESLKLIEGINGGGR
jgi:small-conductance mechanosensitive channel